MASFLMASLLTGADEEYLNWTARQSKGIALAGRVNGQIGKSLDFRIKATDRSYNFKLRATWLTPTVIQALARLEQISRALTDAETRKLVADARSAGDIILQVELDPREGSGIIPNDWVALLGPRRADSDPLRVVRGVRHAKLRDRPALAAVPPRDYAYELFWLVFPVAGEDGMPLFSPADREAQLTVRIQGKAGTVRWPVPDHLR